mmetsp:Transcript_3517/g.5081  ORF Transcript_3517/g.5081 Transcript_3517/m.5081 type:complete len:407 (+) Transcript_3517:61-1281(+)
MGDSGEGVAALLALRAFTSDGKKVEEDGDDYVFGEKRFKKKTQTAFKSGAKEYYELDALVYFLSFGDKFAVGEYVRDARQKKIKMVKHGDRKELTAFMKGQQAWSSKIDAKEPSDGESQAVSTTDEAAKESSSKTAKSDESKLGEAPDATSADQKKKSAKKRKADTASPEEILLRKIKKREDCQRNRNSILLSSHRFIEALRIEKDSARNRTQEKQKELLQGGSRRGDRRAEQVKRMGCPIIVVPASMTAPVNMYNVGDFLGNGRYLHTNEARQIKPHKDSEIIIERQLGEHGVIRFKIVDSVKKFQNQHWDRLAAVLADGPKWQFKDWVWKDTATIFDNCRGLHVHFDDKKLPEHVKKWNVVNFPLKKQSRHQDALQVHRIWMEVEKFLTTKKPDLLKAGKVQRR